MAHTKKAAAPSASRQVGTPTSSATTTTAMRLPPPVRARRSPEDSSAVTRGAGIPSAMRASASHLHPFYYFTVIESS